MWHTIPVLAAVFGGGLLTLPSLPVGGETTPERFGLYSSGPPCTLGHIDRTYSQFQVTRYFTRRFPRPAFTWILARLPRLIAAGKVAPRRVELQFVPQVPARLSEGGAPNRPLRDRARVPAPVDGRAS